MTDWREVTPAIPDTRCRRQIYAGDGEFLIARAWRHGEGRREVQVFYTYEQTPEYSAQQARAQ